MLNGLPDVVMEAPVVASVTTYERMFPHPETLNLVQEMVAPYALMFDARTFPTR